mmetsp:Transcript_12962/g.14906  ORF Transcript_12962/g.14906 Transcript_12962/m.14906 type:complete len:109 (+) Transcript_12962:418-744(+)
MAYNPQISKNLDYNIDRSLHDPRRNYVSKFSLRQDTYREEAKSDNIDHIESDDDEEANISQKMQSSHEQPKKFIGDKTQGFKLDQHALMQTKKRTSKLTPTREEDSEY